jgi:hypothetical protein
MYIKTSFNQEVACLQQINDQNKAHIDFLNEQHTKSQIRHTKHMLLYKHIIKKDHSFEKVTSHSCCKILQLYLFLLRLIKIKKPNALNIIDNNVNALAK